MERVLVHLSRIQQCLGRDATFIQADTTQGTLFKQQGLEACMGSALSTQITGGATADDNQIILCHIYKTSK